MSICVLYTRACVNVCALHLCTHLLQVVPSAIPDKFVLVAEELRVSEGTLSPNSLLEPRRDAVARLHALVL